MYERKIVIYTLRKDKEYKIQSITAFAYFPNSISECYNEQNKLAKEFDSIFPNTKKDIKEYSNPHDKYVRAQRDVIYLLMMVVRRGLLA